MSLGAHVRLVGRMMSMSLVMWLLWASSRLVVAGLTLSCCVFSGVVEPEEKALKT